jgi:glyoxylase-like metal-dependent hydrolase (beta-lactamase superfamily II)
MSNYPVDMSVTPDVKAFFDPDTNTISYVVKDPGSDACAVVDSVMDIDYAAGRITYGHADEIIAWITANGLKLEWIIETHVHADHLSAAPYIQEKLGGKIGIGDQIMVVQDTFGKVFNEGTEFQRDGSQFDALFKDGDTYRIGGMTAFAMYTPGAHACVHGACHGQRRLCRRHTFHARWRIGARRFSRRRCRRALRFDPEGACLAG